MARIWKITEKQQLVLDYLQDNTHGVTADEARHLFEGDISPARSALHTLVERKMIRKKIVRQPREVMGVGTVKVKVALFYPLET